MAHFEKKISSTEQFSGRIFSVTDDVVELENGKTAHREIIRHPGGAGIVPLTEDGQVYLVRQFRYAFGQELLEIPAGKLEPGEDPKFAALRELKEECGLTARQVEELYSIYPTVGYDDEVIYMYLATGLETAEACPDEDEFVTAEKWPLDTLVEMILRGEIRDGKTVAALLKVYTMRNKQ